MQFFFCRSPEFTRLTIVNVMLEGGVIGSWAWKFFRPGRGPPGMKKKLKKEVTTKLQI